MAPVAAKAARRSRRPRRSQRAQAQRRQNGSPYLRGDYAGLMSEAGLAGNGPAANRAGDSWAPADCTLPTAERPLRAADFRELFDGAVIGSERLDDTRLQLRLRRDRDVASRAAALATAETECCSFFVFALTVTADSLLLDVTVPVARTAILDALAVQADA
jgi:hypothetical protein